MNQFFFSQCSPTQGGMTENGGIGREVERPLSEIMLQKMNVRQRMKNPGKRRGGGGGSIVGKGKRGI